jgi:deazaflavin-dependent oxidoreductase (nitroreductase family)
VTDPGPLTGLRRVRRALAMAMWRVMNPVALLMAGRAPWWVVLETTGRRSGRPRRVPLARGPVDASTLWVIAVHGPHAGFARNIAASPDVRVRMRGRWYAGRATLEPLDPAILRRFNAYARLGPRTVGIDPALVRIELGEQGAPAR